MNRLWKSVFSLLFCGILLAGCTLGNTETPSTGGTDLPTWDWTARKENGTWYLNPDVVFSTPPEATELLGFSGIRFENPTEFRRAMLSGSIADTLTNSDRYGIYCFYTDREKNVIPLPNLDALYVPNLPETLSTDQKTIWYRTSLISSVFHSNSEDRVGLMFIGPNAANDCRFSMTFPLWSEEKEWGTIDYRGTPAKVYGGEEDSYFFIVFELKNDVGQSIRIAEAWDYASTFSGAQPTEDRLNYLEELHGFEYSEMDPAPFYVTVFCTDLGDASFVAFFDAQDQPDRAVTFSDMLRVSSKSYTD